VSETLALAKDLNPPLDAVTQTFGCIGRKGSGKTYLAGRLAEQMLDHHAQIIVIDPVGNWYGLRVAADGKSRGKDVFIIGGDHGDIPILPDAGAKIAKLLVEKNVSVILDISGFRQGERKRFAADFAEEFFHLKKSQKSAVHLFVEEAQLFAPQRSGPDEARMLGAFENIIRLGRNYGIGATMISQRPQSINKEVLSQVECLFVLQVNGTHERKALEEWVQEAGADRALVGKLPGLAQGEGYVWSPSWLRIFARFQFFKKVTFDSSATPKVGQAKKQATLTPVDIAALREDLKQVIEKAEADDPAALRRQLAEMKRQLGQAKPATVETIDRAELLRIQQAEFDKVVTANRAHFQQVFGKRIDECIAALEKMRNAINNDQWAPPDLSKDATKSITAAIVKAPAQTLPRNHAITSHAAAGPGIAMGKAERSILTVLAQRGSSSKATVAAYTGYAVDGGGFNNAVGRCRTNGWLVSQGDQLQPTLAGREALGTYEPLPVGPALLEHWRGKLGKAEFSILTTLAREPFEELHKSEIAKATNYEVTGGGFNNALGRLRTLQLIEGSTSIQLKPDFAEAITQ